MNEVTETLRESAAFVDREPRSTITLAPLRESAILGSRIHGGGTAVLRDRAVLSDRLNGAAESVLRETARIHDRAFGRRVISAPVLRAHGRVKDHAEGTVAITATLRDTAMLSDRTASSSVSRLRDHARLHARSAASVSSVARLRGVGRLSDRIKGAAYSKLRDSAVLSDRLNSASVQLTALRGRGRLSDRLGGTYSPMGALRDRGRLHGRTGGFNVATAALRDRAWISGDVVEQGDDTSAWTCCTRSFAMSRYTGFPFESMAGGFAAGPGGVFVPGDAAVPAHIETGDSNYGSPLLKGMSWVYVSGTHATPLQITVTADVHGQQYSQTYTQMPRDASHTRTVRATIGRGFKSNFFRLRFESDAPFFIDGAEALVAPAASRRV